MLRIFNAQENSIICEVVPYCDFLEANQRYLKGCNLLCAYTLFFSNLEAVLPKLSPIPLDYVQIVRTEDDVNVPLAKTFVSQDIFSRKPFHFFSRCSYSNLCRTVTMQDGSVRESTTQIIFHRLLELLDYLLDRSPYWSTANFEKRVNQQIRTFVVQHCEESHRKERDELTGVTLLLILPLLV